MNRDFFASLFTRVQTPDRIAIRFVNDQYAYIESVDKDKDLVDWFCVNSNILEESLNEHNLSWCYLIETVPNERPDVYMLIGHDMTKEFVAEELKDSFNNLPENKQIYIKETPFSSIEIDDYDNSISEFDREFMRKASDVFKVYET